MTTEIHRSRYVLLSLLHMLAGGAFIMISLLMAIDALNESWRVIAFMLIVCWILTAAIMFPLTAMQVDAQESDRYQRRIAELEHYVQYANRKIERLESSDE